MTDAYLAIYAEMLSARKGSKPHEGRMASRELRRVCLLTPGHLSTNPRLVKEADALANAGYTRQRHCRRFRTLGANR